MKRSLIRNSGAALLAASLALGASIVPTAAHHSFAMYDQAKQYVFTGIVVRIAPNPDHQQLYFVPLNEERTQIIRNEAKEPLVWMMEMEAAAIAALQGVTTDNFPAGTIMSVGIQPLRNGQPGGTRGEGAGQETASAIYVCPKDTAPAAGMHCDSVEGSKKYGEGELPEANAVWTP